MARKPKQLTGRIKVPVSEMEFDVGGNTIWIHSPIGATVMRIKTLGKITVDPFCENICSHADIIVKDDVHVCVAKGDHPK